MAMSADLGLEPQPSAPYGGPARYQPVLITQAPAPEELQFEPLQPTAAQQAQVV